MIVSLCCWYLVLCNLCNNAIQAQANTSIIVEFNVSQYSELTFEQEEFFVSNIIKPLKFGTLTISNNNIDGFNLNINSYDHKRGLGEQEDFDFDQVEGLNFVHYLIECKLPVNNENSYISPRVMHGETERACLDTDMVNVRTKDLKLDTYILLTNIEEIIYYDTGYHEDIIVFTLADKE
ncbi:hypothetical protein OAJ27_01745 [bacterium]|nr:hypothetical protein [bacterium]